eukprot:3652847-Pyramimonas_sp.AAC.1
MLVRDEFQDLGALEVVKVKAHSGRDPDALAGQDRLDVLGNAQADLQARKGAALHGLPDGLRQLWQQ